VGKITLTACQFAKCHGSGPQLKPWKLCILNKTNADSKTQPDLKPQLAGDSQLAIYKRD